ncbi:MAG: hypothetical protein IT438_08240 [Phycisphaerales bacterium]|nr:hypothetical protein [Phycisphaerales bacterium]
MGVAGSRVGGAEDSRCRAAGGFGVFGGEHDVDESLEGGEAEVVDDQLGALGGEVVDVLEGLLAAFGGQELNELGELELVVDGELAEGIGGVEEVGDDAGGGVLREVRGGEGRRKGDRLSAGSGGGRWVDRIGLEASEEFHTRKNTRNTDLVRENIRFLISI